MSEPTYRVELSHDPTTAFLSNKWQAKIIGVADDQLAHMTFGATIDEAFDAAQKYVRALTLPQPEGRVVMLSEDGDILDPHEVQR